MTQTVFASHSKARGGGGGGRGATAIQVCTAVKGMV